MELTPKGFILPNIGLTENLKCYLINQTFFIKKYARYIMCCQRNDIDYKNRRTPIHTSVLKTFFLLESFFPKNAF